MYLTSKARFQLEPNILRQCWQALQFTPNLESKKLYFMRTKSHPLCAHYAETPQQAMSLIFYFHLRDFPEGRLNDGGGAFWERVSCSSTWITLRSLPPMTQP